jgi:plastocyanin
MTPPAGARTWQQVCLSIVQMKGGAFMLQRMTLATILMVSVVACGGYSSSPSSPSPTPSPTPTPSGPSVSIVSGASVRTTNAYSPSPLTVNVGDTVTWVNNDNTAHTSTSNGGAWNSSTIPPGGQFSTTFQTAGTYPYHCTIHPGMVGMVVVQ